MTTGSLAIRCLRELDEEREVTIIVKVQKSRPRPNTDLVGVIHNEFVTTELAVKAAAPVVIATITERLRCSSQKKAKGLENRGLRSVTSFLSIKAHALC